MASTSVTPRALTPKEWRMYRGSFAMILLAEAMIFLTLLSTRFLLAGTSRPAGLDQVVAAGLTVLLLVSIVPARQAVAAIARGDQTGLVRQLTAAAVMGVLILAGIVLEWRGAAFSAASRYGEIYFTTAAFHAAHVFIGLIAFLALRSSALRGKYTPENYWTVEAGLYYWYLVVAIWLAVYTVFYLV